MCIKPVGFGMQLFQYFLVAKMQTIEIADGEDAILMFFSAVVQAADNLHVSLYDIGKIIKLAQEGDEPLVTYTFKGEPISKYKYIEHKLKQLCDSTERTNNIQKDIARIRHSGFFGLFK